jgi:aminopeptidase I
MTGSQNKETEMVPIIGLDSSDLPQGKFKSMTLGENGSFAATQPPKLVRAIANELKITDYSSIVNWELELYDTQPAQTGGLEKEFIFGGRIDDKLCSWAAMEALLASSSSTGQAGREDSIIKLVSLFDDEEIGSLLRQGARGNFLPSTIERVVEALAPRYSANILSRTYANSFLISSDVTHAVNPNFVSSYLENHAPRLNVGLAIHADSNGHMTTTSESTALLTRIAEKNGDDLQIFMIRNDSRSGGTVGPMLSSAMGVRAIDAGIPQLSMHSIRATTGSLDPGLGVRILTGFFDHFESVDKEFE